MGNLLFVKHLLFDVELNYFFEKRFRFFYVSIALSCHFPSKSTRSSSMPALFKQS